MSHRHRVSGSHLQETDAPGGTAQARRALQVSVGHVVGGGCPKARHKHHQPVAVSNEAPAQHAPPTGPPGTRRHHELGPPASNGEGAQLRFQSTKVNTMQDRLLRRRDVESTTGMSRASIYRLMQQGDFPRPVKVGSTAVRWKESEIAAWMESRPVATSELGSNAA